MAAYPFSTVNALYFGFKIILIDSLGPISSSTISMLGALVLESIFLPFKFKIELAQRKIQSKKFAI
jgi:hypothetical protein